MQSRHFRFVACRGWQAPADVKDEADGDGGAATEDDDDALSGCAAAAAPAELAAEGPAPRPSAGIGGALGRGPAGSGLACSDSVKAGLSMRLCRVTGIRRAEQKLRYQASWRLIDPHVAKCSQKPKHRRHELLLHNSRSSRSYAFQAHRAGSGSRW